MKAQLTEEEVKAREEKKAAKEEEGKKAKEEEAVKQAEAVAAMDELGKVQYASEKRQAEIVKEAQGRVLVKRLTKAEKDQLFKSVRYSHLQHSELLDAAKNPVFSTLAKDYIMQGLSHRLKPFEGGKEDIEKEYTIELKPRNHYKKEEPPKKEEVPPKKEEEKPKEQDKNEENKKTGKPAA